MLLFMVIWLGGIALAWYLFRKTIRIAEEDWNSRDSKMRENAYSWQLRQSRPPIAYGLLLFLTFVPIANIALSVIVFAVYFFWLNNGKFSRDFFLYERETKTDK